MPTQSAVRRRNSMRVIPNPDAGVRGSGTDSALLTHRVLQLALCMEQERLFRNNTLDKSTAGLGAASIDSSIPPPGSVQDGVGWGPEQHDLVGGTPAHGRRIGTR